MIENSSTQTLKPSETIWSFSFWAKQIKFYLILTGLVLILAVLDTL